MHPLCLLRLVWRSIRCGAWVAGHDYATSKEKTPENVHVLECMVCKHVDVCWSWTSMERYK